MDANLTAFSTEMLKELLEAKLKKPKSPHMVQIIEAIENEIKSRQEKVK
jgi:hypothetical protein